MSTVQNEDTNSMLKFIAKGGVIIFAGGVMGKILRFIFGIILARVLGAALFGLYAIGQSIIDVATNIGLLGDGWAAIGIVTRFRHDKDAPRLKGAILGYLLISFLITMFISVLVFFSAEYVSVQILHYPMLTGVLKIFFVGFPLYILSLAVITIGTAFRRLEFKMIIQEITQPLVNIITVTIIFMLGGRLYGAVSSFVISSFFSAALGAYLLKKVFPEINRPSTYIVEIKNLLKKSLPIMGIIVCYYLLFRLDRIMLGVFRSAHEVGIYSAASNTAMSMLIFTGMFESSLSPIIAQLHHGGKREELKRIFNYVTFIGVAMAFIPCMAMVIFSQEIISLFGVDFVTGKMSLVILSLTFFLDIVPGQLRQLFQMSSKQNIEFINSLIMISSNFSLNMFLIPLFGIEGAALSALFSVALVSIVRTVELKIFFKFLPFTWQYVRFLIFAVSVFASILLFVMNNNILFKIVSLSVLIVGFIFFFFKLQSKQDLLLWRDIKANVFKFNFINS